MRAVSKRQISTANILKIILLLAILLRVASALFQGNSVEPLPGIHDQISYDELARRVIEGHGFSFATNHWPATQANQPTAHWSFLYTLYLSATYLIFGVHPLAARLIQALVVGLLHTWLAWRIGKRIFGPTVGLLAALLSATYLYFVYYSGALITESFYIVGILWTMDVALRLAARQLPASTLNETPGEPPRSTAWLWVELGLAAGVTILLRQLFLLFMPFLLLWLWWSSERLNANGSAPDRSGSSVHNGKRRTSTQRRMHLLAGSLLCMAIVISLIAPWTIRNYRAFGQFVPLNTNSGYAFFWGNHPYYGTKFVGILPEDGPSYLDLIPKELLGLDEAALDKALLQRGLGFVIQDPVRYLLLSLSRGQEYFKFWPSPDSSILSNIVRVGSFGLALPFILYGLWVTAGTLWQGRNRYQQAAITLLYLFMAVYTAIHLLVWTLIRYRLPVDSLFLIFAAVGLYKLVGWVMSHPLFIQTPQHSTPHSSPSHSKERLSL
ncbi:MAG: glycosyltransferase family 39 protein [Caldilineaceae bacterium]|nr:glycosyltransferase family 39 protein [Caldilineaceae bacterium]